MTKEEKLKVLKEVLGSCYRSGNEYLFFCQKCKHHKPKLSVNVEKNAFKCWICDFRGTSIKRLIRRYGSFLQRQQWEKLSGEIDISQPFEASIFSDLKDKEEIIEETIDLPKEFVSLANKNLPLSSIEPRKYLLSRGIKKEDILKWKIGYAKDGFYGKRIIVPSFDLNGNANYFISRSYTGHPQKYLNPNISKDLVFNELFTDWKNDLILVEGVFDAIKTDNAIPLLGSSLNESSKLFQEIVKHDTPIFVALDPDAEKKAFRLIKSLLLYDVETYKIDISGYADVGEMTKEQFRERKSKATPINSETYMENIIQWRI